MIQTILLVDDEAKLRAMLRVYLEQEGYHVVEAGNGREALYVARLYRNGVWYGLPLRAPGGDWWLAQPSTVRRYARWQAS
jgi:CheY-like chemotaxis protein